MEELTESLKNQSNIEIEQISHERVKFKLSLRKNKFNEILLKRRIFETKPEDSPWTHELFLSNLKLPSNYKIIFAKEEDEIETALKAINSDYLFEVKYGICLLKNYISHFPVNNKLNFNLNLNFISDLLNLLEKWGNKKEKQIVFNILYIMTDYSFINTNKTISKFFLSSKGYKIWDLCFNLQDYEIMSQLIWILENIINDEEENSYNLLKSNFFQKKIYNFYNSSSIFRHLNEKNQKNLFYIIIEKGINLFNNLLSKQSSNNTYHKEEKYKLSINVFELILKYCETNSKNIFYSCIYSISIAIDNEPRLINLLDKSNLLNDILNKKFFSEDNIILNSNRILGEYIANKSNLSNDFYEKCTNYEMDIFFSTKSISIIIDVFWVLSNIMHDSLISLERICSNNLLIDKAINIYKNSNIYKIIRETSYFFLVIIQLANINTFLELQNKGLIEISFEHLKNIINVDKYDKIIILFELIQIYLEKGEIIKNNFGGNNFIKEKCDKYGLRDLLRKYENSDNKELEEIIETIINKYYNKY